MGVSDFCDKVWQGVGGLLLQYDVIHFKKTRYLERLA